MSVTIENSGATAIRPFTIPGVPEAELEALRARIANTPLLFVAFAEDHIVPAKASHHNAEHYDASTAIIAFKESLADRTSRRAALGGGRRFRPLLGDRARDAARAAD
jgi:hypothetical protein